MTAPTTSPVPTAERPVAEPPAASVRHRPFEDVLGVLIGTVVVSLGLDLLRSGGVVSGGTAGLSLLLSYAGSLPFGVLFVGINLPFFLYAVRGKGWGFTLRSGAAIALVSTLTELHASSWALGPLALTPAYAAVLGNVLCGVGLLILFRHGASLGGFNIVALVLQERAGLRAGYVLMVLDTLVVLAALSVRSPMIVLISAVGALLLNLTIALNHRPGRYLGSRS